MKKIASKRNYNLIKNATVSSDAVALARSVGLLAAQALEEGRPTSGQIKSVHTLLEYVARAVAAIESGADLNPSLRGIQGFTSTSPLFRGEAGD